LAGGSARWMFGYSPAAVVADIKKQLDKVTDLKSLAAGFTGNRSSIAINHLFMTNSNGDSFLISEYVSRKLASHCETSFIHQARQSRLAHNPTFDGWILEADFLMQLRLAMQGDFSLANFQAPAGAVAKWTVSGTESFHTETSIEEFDIKRLSENVWLIPDKWNQPCYDAVQLTTVTIMKKKTPSAKKTTPCKVHGVRVVQVTRASSHAVKLKYVVLLLEALVKAGYAVEALEIAIVVPHETDPDNITITFDGNLGTFKEMLQQTKRGNDCSFYGLYRTK